MVLTWCEGGAASFAVYRVSYYELDRSGNEGRLSAPMSVAVR
ncbi:hypothetical protein ONA91_35925 [Micromonospora sp. DR5-3]|nr:MULTISPECIES: hypothetical protein [unclassified Micromonospora]MCW3819839.1 hypothetical protein [Micromonospora sp. DR5-3]